MNAAFESVSKTSLSTPSSEDLRLDHTSTSEFIDMIPNLVGCCSQQSTRHGEFILCEQMLSLIFVKTQVSYLSERCLGQAFGMV